MDGADSLRNAMTEMRVLAGEAVLLLGVYPWA